LRKFALGGLALMTAAGLAAKLAVPGEEKDGPKGAEAPSMEEMMKQWQAIASPGKAHQLLDPMVGTFEATVKLWMGGPGTPSSESKGKMTSRWVLGGRFVLQEFEGTMAMPGGADLPFNGIGMLGYDNFRNVYVSTWADSMGTQILVMKGSAGQAGKTLDLYGEMDEPALKVVGRLVRCATRLIDRDHHVFEMFDLNAGPDYKVMEIAYTRKP
jgi:hypothetical protein